MEETFGATGTLLRETKGEVVLVSRLRVALEQLNPALPPEAISAAVAELTRDRSAMSLEAANREVYLLLKEGIKVSVPDTESTPHPGPSREPRSSGRESAPSKPGRDQSRLTSAATVQKGGGGNGGQKTERVRVIDWEHPANNDFLLVSHFSATGALSETSAFILHPSSLLPAWGHRVEEARRARALGIRREPGQAG